MLKLQKQYMVFKSIFVFILLVFLFSGLITQAAPPPMPDEAWDLQDVINLMAKIRDAFLVIGIISIVIFFVWSGIAYLTARDDQTKISAAKQKLTWSIVGTIIILSTFVIIATIKSFLEKKWL